MIRFSIYETGRENVAHVFDCRDGHFREIYHEVYDHLHYFLEQSHAVAAEAADWCEFASVPDLYEADGFYIEVEEV